jgi:hypothetical protein
MASERESLIDELHRELARVRAALVASMDWGWSAYVPPDEIVARCETALGLTDTIAAFFSLEPVSSPAQGTHAKAA